MAAHTSLASQDGWRPARRAIDQHFEPLKLHRRANVMARNEWGLEGFREGGKDFVR